MIKSTTAMDYQQRMSWVTLCLFNHLDDDIRVDELAEVASLELHTRMCLPRQTEM